MPGGGLLGALLPLGLNVGFKSNGFGYGDEDQHAIIRDALDPNVPGGARVAPRPSLEKRGRSSNSRISPSPDIRRTVAPVQQRVSPRDFAEAHHCGRAWQPPHAFRPCRQRRFNQNSPTMCATNSPA